jgi:hypothetical protein
MESRWLHPSCGTVQDLPNGGPPGSSLPDSCSVAAELALAAVRAVEDNLRRLVIGQPGLTALLVGQQPVGVALGALRDQSDTLGSHAPTLSGRSWEAPSARLARDNLLAGDNLLF